MLVSHSKKFIFLKTVKTGGTSVEGALEKYCLPPGTPSPCHARPETVSEYGIVGARQEYLKSYKTYYSHIPASELRPLVGEQVWNSYYKFTIVRHPYEKAISSFFFSSAQNGKEFTDEDIDTAREAFQKSVREKKRFLRDQHIFTIDGKLAVDGILHHETLPEDLRTLSAHLHLDLDTDQLPRFKAGLRPKSATVEDFITPELAEIIDDAFQFEFNHLGYQRLGDMVASPTEQVGQP